MSKTARNNLVKTVNEAGAFPQPYSSDFSDVVVTETVGDVTAPNPPDNITVSNGTERIILSWDKPTENEDGSTCNDFLGVKIYYSSSSGIDVDNDSTYDGVEIRYAESWSHEVSSGNTMYYKLVSLDETENPSEPSSEYSGTSNAVSIGTNVSDYTQNISNVEVGNHIIGIEFQKPSSSWTGFSRYALYEAEDSGGGFGSYMKIFEGNQPGFLRKGLNSSYSYKYKLTFIDTDGNETSGTVKDNGGSGYQPNQDNSNITAYLFVGNLVATEEVKGDAIYAESSITLGGIDNSGYIKSSNYSFGSSGFKINASGSAYFSSDLTVGDSGTSEYMQYSSGTLTIRGSLNADDISAGSLSISYITGEGSLAHEDDVRASSSEIYIDSSLEVSGNLYCAGGSVKMGQGVTSDGGNGILVTSGGKIQVTDNGGTVVFDSSGNFRGASRLGDLNRDSHAAKIASTTKEKVIDFNADKPVAGGQVLLENDDSPTDCYIEITDDSGSYKIYHIDSTDADANATRTTTAPNWNKDALLFVLPAFQPKGSCSLHIYNGDTASARFYQYKLWYT